MWWRLSSGPIALDLATPWITAAIEQNFGTRHKVEIGGTILERDEHGRTAVRIRDIVVREPDGRIVASAPRAEVGLSHASLLTGQPRAESLNLVGAEISVRIGADGQFTLLTSDQTAATQPKPAGCAVDRPARSCRNRYRRRFCAKHRRILPHCWPGSTACVRLVSTVTISAKSV